MSFALVTATLDLERSRACVDSWLTRATMPPHVYTVLQASSETKVEWAGRWSTLIGVPEILGVVPAFAVGVQRALDDGHTVIGCLHDDLEIDQQGWDTDVLHLFKACPRAGLCGFGGGKGLGSDDIYQTPYNPMQLARQGFRSNLRSASQHGVRGLVAEPVACLDGFSQIGTRGFWLGRTFSDQGFGERKIRESNLFAEMQSWGVTHHFYDGMLGCFARRLGYMVWYLPIACEHYGGRTAVGDARYAEWATQFDDGYHDDQGYHETARGDQALWQIAHKIGYSEFRDCLPIRT